MSRIACICTNKPPTAMFDKHLHKALKLYRANACLKSLILRNYIKICTSVITVTKTILRSVKPLEYGTYLQLQAMTTATKQLFVNDRSAVREAFGKSDKEALEDVEIIRNWVQTQPHLPEVPSDNLIEIFLTANKFSIEKTKQKLDMYYTIRSLIPEFYENAHPLSPEMTDDLGKMGSIVALPKQTKDHYKVFIFTFSKSVEDFNPFKYLMKMFNILEMKAQHDAAAGDIVIVDCDNITMSHVVKFTPIFLKNTGTVLEKVYSNRIKGIHVVNHLPFVNIILSVCKSVLNPKLYARFQLHDSVEELYEYIPREILPKDLGGGEISIQELNELWKDCFRENSDRFNKLDKMRVKEELRPTPLKNDELLGYHGNFKKLEVF